MRAVIQNNADVVVWNDKFDKCPFAETIRRSYVEKVTCAPGGHTITFSLENRFRFRLRF